MKSNLRRSLFWALLGSLGAWAFLILLFQANDAEAAAPDIFDRYMDADIPVADGFDFPVGEKTIFAVAAGRVVEARDLASPLGKGLLIEHLYYENHHKRRIRSRYLSLESIRVKKGQHVLRGQVLGTMARDGRLDLAEDLRLPSGAESLPRWHSPIAFIRVHRKLFVPHEEAHLALVDHDSLRMALYEKGVRKASYEVAFGQSTGRKRRRGDLRTPKGMYFVVHRYKGEFAGPFGDFYGGHWIKINYPNTYDADYGLGKGWIGRGRRDEIARDWVARRPTAGKTPLGGGIGFHGWASEWENDGPRGLSWGCVVLHLTDVALVYRDLPEGSMVVLF